MDCRNIKFEDFPNNETNRMTLLRFSGTGYPATIDYIHIYDPPHLRYSNKYLLMRLLHTLDDGKYNGLPIYYDIALNQMVIDDCILIISSDFKSRFDDYVDQAMPKLINDINNV